MCVREEEKEGEYKQLSERTCVEKGIIHPELNIVILLTLFWDFLATMMLKVWIFGHLNNKKSPQKDHEKWSMWLVHYIPGFLEPYKITISVF